MLFDVDDTTLNTYNYEIYSNFVYNPTTNAAFVNAAVFPAVPHMVDLEKFARRHGYTVFFLTGRPEIAAGGHESPTCATRATRSNRRQPVPQGRGLTVAELLLGRRRPSPARRSSTSR